MPLPHMIQECPAADSPARYTAKLILPLVLAELNSYQKLNVRTVHWTTLHFNLTYGIKVGAT